MQPALRPDFTTVTEQPRQGATRLQMAMLATRYAWAAGHAAQKDVAEIACGAGLGLGWLARMARSVEAGDLDEANCRTALETYAGHDKIRIRQMDALHLPFADASRDVILLFEALYYLPNPQTFFEEARRVLRPGGTLLISTVNREWAGFNPSPFHVSYLSASGLHDTLAGSGFAVNLYAGFPERHSPRDVVIGKIRRAAVKAHLIPQTLSGKEFLKRIFYGSLEQIPRELEPGGATGALSPLCPEMNLSVYRTLYAEARKVS